MDFRCPGDESVDKRIADQARFGRVSWSARAESTPGPTPALPVRSSAAGAGRLHPVPLREEL